MTIQVERAHGLEALGIVRAGHVTGTSAPPRCMSRRCAAARRTWPLRGRSWPGPDSTPAAHRTTSLSSSEPQSEQHVHWGAVNKPIDEAKFDLVHRDMMAYARTSFRARRLGRTDPTYRMPIRVVNEFAWHNLFARNMFLPEDDPAKRATSAGVHGHRLSKVQGRPAARHALGGIHPRALRPQARADRRHALRRRDQEVHIHHSQYMPAAGRHADALLGERRRRRGHGAFLRPVGHGQDHAVERPTPALDWRRRAWLERHGRLQLRGRLLCEGDQVVSRSGAADLRDDETLRHHPRERGHRSGRTDARPRRRLPHRKHPRLLSHQLHRQRRAVRPCRASSNVVMLTADAYGVLPPIAG